MVQAVHILVQAAVFLRLNTFAHPAAEEVVVMAKRLTLLQVLMVAMLTLPAEQVAWDQHHQLPDKVAAVLNMEDKMAVMEYMCHQTVQGQEVQAEKGEIPH